MDNAISLKATHFKPAILIAQATLEYCVNPAYKATMSAVPEHASKSVSTAKLSIPKQANAVNAIPAIL